MQSNCMPPEQLTLVASYIAVALSCGRSTDDLNLLGNLFQAIGQNMSLIATQRDRCAQ